MITPKTAGKLVIDLLGDSKMYKMESDGQGVLTPNAGLRLIFWGGGPTYWVAGSQLGAGVVALGNALIAATGIPNIDFRLGAMGGSALCAGAGGGVGYWTNLAGSPWSVFAAVVAASAEPADFAIIDLGTNDIGVSHPGVFRDTFQQFIAQASGLAWDQIFLVGLGNWYAQGSPVVNEIRWAQQAAIALSSVVLACTDADQPMVDGVHLTVAGDISKGQRLAQSILYHYGYASTSGLGPKLVSSARSGSDVINTYALPPGAATIRQATAGVPVGYLFSGDGFASHYAITGFTILSPTTAKFSFASPIVGQCIQTFCSGNIAPDPSIICDDTALACPQQPTVQPTVVT